MTVDTELAVEGLAMRLPTLEARAGGLERRMSKQNKSFAIVCATRPPAERTLRTPR